jgi:hypothetical protein
MFAIKYIQLLIFYNLTAQHVSALIDHLQGQPVLKETVHNSHEIFLEYLTHLN